MDSRRCRLGHTREASWLNELSYYCKSLPRNSTTCTLPLAIILRTRRALPTASPDHPSCLPNEQQRHHARAAVRGEARAIGLGRHKTRSNNESQMRTGALYTKLSSVAYSHCD
jgi:hypothetical protein